MFRLCPHLFRGGGASDPKLHQRQQEEIKEKRKYREMGVWRSSSLVLDRPVIMKQVPKHPSFQHCFDDSFDHVVEVLYHSQGTFKHDSEPLGDRVHRRVELKYIDLFASVKQ